MSPQNCFVVPPQRLSPFIQTSVWGFYDSIHLRSKMNVPHKLLLTPFLPLFQQLESSPRLVPVQSVKLAKQPRTSLLFHDNRGAHHYITVHVCICRSLPRNNNYRRLTALTTVAPDFVRPNWHPSTTSYLWNLQCALPLYVFSQISKKVLQD